MSKKYSDTQKKKMTRLPGQTGNLFVPPEVKEPGYSYRFVQDAQGKLYNALHTGYQFLPSDHVKNYASAIGDSTLKEGSSVVGDRIVKFGGVDGLGKEYNMVLMRIPNEKLEELRAHKNDLDNELDVKIGKGGQYGNEI